jgi:hypothetical protein
MKFRNPARHYPSYLCHVHFKDRLRRSINIRGASKPEIELSVKEEDVLAVVVKILDASREVKMTKLLVDGEWSDYSEEALEAIASPPKPKPKSAPKPKPAPKPKRTVKKAPKPKDGDEAEAEDGRFGLGCT